MNDSSKENGCPSAWGMAYQWGTALVAYTCVFGLIGYYLGDRILGGKYGSLGLMMVGIVGGFSVAIYQIFKTSQRIDKAIPNRGKPLSEETEDKTDVYDK